MSENQDGPVYTRPPTQDFAEAVEKDDYVPPTVKKHGEDQPLSEDGFINVSAEYRNYANDTAKPLVGEEGPEAAIEERHLADDYDADAGATPEGVAESDDGEEDEESGQTPTPQGGGGYTPPTPSSPQP